MKYISKWYMACLAMALCCLAVACSDEEEIVPVEVTFTAPCEFDMASLDSCESIVSSFELTSNGAWSLYSDKMWVKLSLYADGEFFNDIQGGEGTHTVYIKVTNDARGFGNAKANVTLVAGGVSKSVVTVERTGKEHEFALLSSDGEVLEEIEIGTDATVWVAPVANFDCSIISCPAWLLAPEALDGGFTLKVAADDVPYEKEGTVVFGNIDGNVTYEVPVAYVGMERNLMKIEGENTPWGWKVSPDGKTFLQETTSASGENIETVIEDALTFSVTCFNYDYKLVPLQVNNGKLEEMSADESWIVATQNENEPSLLSVSVAEMEATSRSGYLLAVPAAMYSNFADSLAVSSDVDTFIDSNISYVVLEVEQKSLEDTDGFIITDADGAAVACATEEEYYEWLCSEFSIEDLTACELVPGKSYTIVTRLNASDWQGNFAITDLEGAHQRLKSWGNPSPELGEDGLYRMNITVPASLNKTIILRLYTPQIVNIKALVIRPVSQ
ncbi:MAG: DUF5003 domain-containing protein [Bacteroidaceae bacterium]|nr:DUF5003 domain-containing protein [Bacteroidaceae bacterium]